MVATSAYRGITLHLTNDEGASASVTILDARTVKDAVQTLESLPLPPSFADGTADVMAWERAYQFLPQMVEVES